MENINNPQVLCKYHDWILRGRNEITSEQGSPGHKTACQSIVQLNFEPLQWGVKCIKMAVVPKQR